MKNIFKNAKFGALYVTEDGVKNVFCSFTHSGNETLARLYREKWGVVIFYLDGKVHSGCEFGKGIDFTIIGQWQEPIDEEGLADEAITAAIEYNKELDNTMTPDQEYWYQEGYKACYRKAMEDKQ